MRIPEFTNKKFNFRTCFDLLPSILAILLLIASQYLFINILTLNYQSNLLKDNRAILNSFSDSLDLWINDYLKMVRMTARDHNIVNATEELLKLEVNNEVLINSKPQKELRAYFKDILKSELYKGFLIIDKNGHNLASSENVNVGIESILSKNNCNYSPLNLKKS